MTLTIELPVEIERRIRDEASARGISEEAVVLDVLVEGLGHSSHGKTVTSSLPEPEAVLIQAINQGMTESEWNRYHQLIRLRQNESLTPSEHHELVEVTERLEKLHADRIENVVRLAQLRKIPVEELMNAMGLRNPGYV